MSREEADEKALTQYEQFAARRREQLEAALRELEEQTKRLPKTSNLGEGGGL